MENIYKKYLSQTNNEYESLIDSDPKKFYTVIKNSKIYEGFTNTTRYKIFEKVSSNNLEVFYYTLELLRNAEKSGIVVSHKDALCYLSILLSGEEERCLSLKDNRDCVHMANLHKLKGLEAPIVILSESAFFMPPVEYRVEHLDTGSEGWVFAITEQTAKGTSFEYFNTDEFKDKKNAEKSAMFCEGDRLIYVGATRARNVLILCNQFYYKMQTKVYNSRWKPIIDNYNLSDFFNVFEPSKEKMEKEKLTVLSSDLYDEAAKESVLNDKTSEEKTYEIINPSSIKVSSKMADEQVVVSSEMVDMAETKKRRYAALIGTMVHRYMELIVSSKGTLSKEKAIKEILREYKMPVNDEFESNAADILKKVADKMENGGFTQENGSESDIFDILFSSEENCCEVPFCYRGEEDGESVIYNGVMDVIYKKDGKWHIVDYKTNLDGQNLDEKYKGQLDAYRKAFKEMTGEEAEARIYHISI